MHLTLSSCLCLPVLGPCCQACCWWMPASFPRFCDHAVHTPTLAWPTFLTHTCFQISTHGCFQSFTPSCFQILPTPESDFMHLDKSPVCLTSRVV